MSNEQPEPDYRQSLHDSIVQTAESLISRSVGVVEASRRLMELAAELDAWEDEDRRFHWAFIGLSLGLSPDHLDPVILDHRIGEQLVGRLLEQLFSAGLVAAIELDVEHLALPDAGDALNPERAQRALDGLALRVEDAGLQRDGDAGFHGAAYGTSR